MNHLRLDTGQADRLTMWIDVEGRSVNVLFEAVFDELRTILDDLERRRQRLPLVLRSAKAKGFVVGADLHRIAAINSEEEIQHFLLVGQQTLQRLERFDGDTLAVIEGACFGGGLELALACRYRLASSAPGTQLGMPEARLGLMPGWGGTQRLIETVGLEPSVHLLLTGESVDAQRALALGLVDACFDKSSAEEQIAKFIQSLAGRPAGRQHELREAHGPRGGDASRSLTDSPNGSHAADWLRSRSNDHSPAQAAILEAVAAGLEQSREAGFRAERELFYPLLVSPTARESLQRFIDKRAGQ